MSSIRTIASFNNLHQRILIREFTVINSCAKNNIIISLDMYDKQLLMGSKCLYERYITKIFIINAIRKKIKIVLQYSGLFFTLFLNHFSLFFNLFIIHLNHIKYIYKNLIKAL